jgi:general secretion pathway protein C
MVSNLGNRWAVAVCTLALWALVAASAVYWGTKLIHRGPIVPEAPAARTSVAVDPAAVARVLGASPAVTAAAAAPSLASRFNLIGVVYSHSQYGTALIAVDGKPARPFRVGAQIEEGLVLQSVEPRRASLGAKAEGPPAITLELPLRK